MSDYLAMELRAVSMEERTITGIVAPYDEVSYLTPDPKGERVIRGAFKKSILQRPTKIPLCRNHEHGRALGMSREWADGPEGLTGTFHVRPSVSGDEALEEARDGYLSGLSVGFAPLNQTRGADGVREVREARLLEVSLVVIGAYEGAKVLAVRNAQDLDKLLAPFANPPHVDLSPIPSTWGYSVNR